MNVTVVPVTPFQQNCSVLRCEETGAGAVVDPGGDLPAIRAAISRSGAQVEKILVTHGHVDHAGGVAALAAALKVPVEGPHRADRFWIEAMSEQGRQWGLAEARGFEPDRWLDDGDEVLFGALRLAVLHCPGHTPGHVVFHEARSGIALVGDVLFRGSIGRSDFPGGDHATLLRSIRERLWPLGEAVRFVPGHGPMSSFGAERRNNPFVRDPSPA